MARTTTLGFKYLNFLFTDGHPLNCGAKFLASEAYEFLRLINFAFLD